MTDKPESLNLGNFEILEDENGSPWCLGRGVYGTTYKARHRILGNLSAVKVINDSLMQNREIRKRFLHEARSVAKLDHPNITRVFDADEQDETFYYAMDFCEGGTLAELCQSRGKLSWEEVKVIAEGIGRGLGHAHSKGLLHRDIKPTNLMLMKPNDLSSVKLIDFGLVKVLREADADATVLDLTREGSFMGNTMTASPEQVLEEDLDERSDLFSLGVTLWFLLVGDSPFGDQKTGKVLQRRLSMDSYANDLPLDFPEHARNLIGKLLQKDPADRFASADEFLEALGNPDYGILCEEVEEPTDDGIAGPVPEEPVENPFANLQIEKKIARVSSGELFVATTPGSSERFFVLLPPKADLNTIEKSLEVLASLPESKLLNLRGRIKNEGDSLYVFDPVKGRQLSELLSSNSQNTFQNCLSILRPVAGTVDLAVDGQLPGVELVPEMIWITPGDGETAGCQLVPILLEKEQPFDPADTVPVGGQTLETSMIPRLGALIYRMVSGMAIKPAAFHVKEAYVATSNLSEDSNLLLKSVIAGEASDTSASALVSKILNLEGGTRSGVGGSSVPLSGARPKAVRTPRRPAVAIPSQPEERSKTTPLKSAPKAVQETAAQPTWEDSRENRTQGSSRLLAKVALFSVGIAFAAWGISTLLKDKEDPVATAPKKGVTKGKTDPKPKPKPATLPAQVQVPAHQPEPKPKPVPTPAPRPKPAPRPSPAPAPHTLPLTTTTMTPPAPVQTKFELKDTFSDLRQSQKITIANKIWANHSMSKPERLTEWQDDKAHLSLGIGHFLWYPKDAPSRWRETWPSFVKYATAQGLNVPSFAREPHCPWSNQASFKANAAHPQVSYLRRWLGDSRTKEIQAAFMAQQSREGILTAVKELSTSEQDRILLNYEKVSSAPHGVFALIDYAVFKGYGTTPEETYQGKGWGLNWVLMEMQNVADGYAAVREFSMAARRVLDRRIRNAPQIKDEPRHRAHWHQRCESYLVPIR